MPPWPSPMRARLVHRRGCAHGGAARLADRAARRAVQLRRPRHHDLNDFKAIEGDRRWACARCPFSSARTGGKARLRYHGAAAGRRDRLVGGLGYALSRFRRRRAAGGANRADAPPAGRSAQERALVQRHGHDALRPRVCWISAFAVGAVLMESAMTRDTAQLGRDCPARPGADRARRHCGPDHLDPQPRHGGRVAIRRPCCRARWSALHYVIQILRPRWGYGSDMGGRRTPWIIGGMAVLALGGSARARDGAHGGIGRLPGIAVRGDRVYRHRHRRGGFGHFAARLLATQTAPARRAPQPPRSSGS